MVVHESLHDRVLHPRALDRCLLEVAFASKTVAADEAPEIAAAGRRLGAAAVAGAHISRVSSRWQSLSEAAPELAASGAEEAALPLMALPCLHPQKGFEAELLTALGGAPATGWE